ncbi:hypothetical protein BK139_07745 [Paenibacillus sp. FSL R5-0490]|nr:hypothetical protein BK139_07745 [Paenibacillus sp. FSL R5-0490]
MNLCTFFIKPKELGELRTQKAKIRIVESEPGATSDTKGRKARDRVRTWSNFRHKRQESAR